MFHVLQRRIRVSLILSIMITLMFLSSINCFLHIRLIYNDYVNKVTQNSEQFISSMEFNLNLVEESANFFKNKYNVGEILKSPQFNTEFNRYMINLPNSNFHIYGAMIYVPDGSNYFSSGIYINPAFSQFISSFIGNKQDEISKSEGMWFYVPEFPVHNESRTETILYILPIKAETATVGYMVIDLSTDELVNIAKMRKSIFHNDVLTYLKFDDGVFVFENSLSEKIDFSSFSDVANGSIIKRNMVTTRKNPKGYLLYDVVHLTYVYEQFGLIIFVTLLVNAIIIAFICFSTKPFVKVLLSPLDNLYNEMNTFSNDKEEF